MGPGPLNLGETRPRASTAPRHVGLSAPLGTRQLCAFYVPLWRYLRGGWQNERDSDGSERPTLLSYGQLGSKQTTAPPHLDRGPGLGRDTFYLPNSFARSSNPKNIPIRERVKEQLNWKATPQISLKPH